MKNNQLFNGTLLFFLFIIGALVFSNINHRYKGFKNSNRTVLTEIMDNKRTINYLTLSQILSDESTPYTFVDLRAFSSFEAGHIPTAINMPFEQLTKKETKHFFKKNKNPTIIYSDAQNKSSLAFLLLTSMGIDNIYILSGNYEAIAEYVLDNLSPSHYHYNEEKAKWDYARLMRSHAPAVEKTPAATPEIPQAIEIKTPVTGGC